MMVKRYDQYHGPVRSTMVENPHGDYVPYADYERVVNVLKDLSYTVFDGPVRLFTKDQDGLEKLQQIRGRVQEVLK